MHIRHAKLKLEIAAVGCVSESASKWSEHIVEEFTFWSCSAAERKTQAAKPGSQSELEHVRFACCPDMLIFATGGVRLVRTRMVALCRTHQNAGPTLLIVFSSSHHMLMSNDCTLNCCVFDCQMLCSSCSVVLRARLCQFFWLCRSLVWMGQNACVLQRDTPLILCPPQHVVEVRVRENRGTFLTSSSPCRPWC